MTGLRVVDLSDGIAGAYCAKLLGDLGAQVVVVEAPGGSSLRRWSAAARAQGRLPGDDEPDGALFRYLRASCVSRVIDLSTPEGERELLDRLVDADVLIDDRGPRAIGPTHDQVAAINPRLVDVRISPFGARGPWVDRPANEFTLHAWAGSTGKRGEPDREPLQAGGRTGDWLAGTFAALGAMAAVRGVRQHGVGDLVDVSELESLVIGYTVYRTLWESMGHRASRTVRGLEIPSIEPTADGLVGFCTVMGQMWHDFCHLIGHPEWTEQPDLNRWGGRGHRSAELRGAIADWLSDKTSDEVIQMCADMRIPATYIGNGVVTPTIEQFVARGSFVENPHGFVQPRPPYRFEAFTTRPVGPAPSLGEGGDVPCTPTTDSAAGGSGGGAPAQAGVDSRALPLAGITVADFSGAIAGSYGAQVLGMLGAEIIKIESTSRPDPARTGSIRNLDEDLWWEFCPLFLAANTGKRAVTLRLDRPEGLAIAERIISRCDVVLENFSPRVMEAFGLDRARVAELNPQAIYVRMPAFGLDGPWRDRVGFAQTQEQLSGLAWLTGYADRAPILPQGLCDWLSGAHAAIAVMAGLAHREDHHEGGLIELTMAETAINVAAEAVVEYGSTGYLLQRMGNRSPGAAPQGTYRCQGDDVWVAISIDSDERWRALVDALSDTRLDAARFGDEAGRWAAQDEIDGVLAEWCASRTPEDVVAQLWPAGVPCAPVVDAADLLDNPQLVDRGFLEVVDHPLVGAKPGYLGLPFRMGSDYARRWNRSPAPTLGQHNFEVLTGVVGLDPAEVERLVETGVSGTTPLGLQRGQQA